MGIEQESPEFMYWRVDAISGADVLRSAAPYVGGRVSAGSTDRKLSGFMQVDAVVAGSLAGDLRVSFGPSLSF